MKRAEYMKELEQKLRRLPKEDYDRAIEYFEEYFDEAGPENEQEAINDLGSPDNAANGLIMNLAVKNTKEQQKTLKKGFSAVWVGVLGVCAVPIALPLAFALVAVVAALLLAVAACVFSFFLAAATTTLGGVLGIVGGFILLFTSFANGVATVGFSIAVLGAGIALCYGSGIFCRWILRKTTLLLGKITKGGKRHEAKK